MMGARLKYRRQTENEQFAIQRLRATLNKDIELALEG